MKKKRLPMPVDYWNPGATETWLEEMELQGWHYAGAGIHRVTLTECEPRRCRVRLHPEEYEWKDIREERRAAYAEMGWHYAGDLEQYVVYYCYDASAPELETDPVAQQWAWEKRLKQAAAGPWRGLLVVFFAVAVLVFSTLKPGENVEMLIRSGGIYLFVLAAVPWCIVEAVKSHRKIRTLRRQLESGVPITHTGDSKKMRRQAVWSYTVSMLLLLWSIAGSPLRLYWSTTQNAREDVDAATRWVTAEMLDPEQFDPKDRTYDHVGRDWELLAPERYDVKEIYPQQAQVQNHYSRLRFETLAEWLYAERLAQWLEQYEGCARTAVTDDRFDQAVLLEWEHVRMFLAQKDEVVYSVWANVPVELDAHLHEFAAVMAAQP